MNKTRQTEISSEFLADVWLVPRFLGPEEQPTHWQSKWLFQKSLGGVFSPCPCNFQKFLNLLTAWKKVLTEYLILKLPGKYQGKGLRVESPSIF